MCPFKREFKIIKIYDLLEKYFGAHRCLNSKVLFNTTSNVCFFQVVSSIRAKQGLLVVGRGSKKNSSIRAGIAVQVPFAE